MPKKTTGKPVGRPRKNVKVPKPTKSAKPPKSTPLDLSSRDSLVAFRSATLQRQITDADDLVAYYKARLELIADSGNVAGPDVVVVENGYRQALKHRDDLWTKLSKQLELMEDLASRGESDPLYTPVHLHITIPTQDMIAQPEFEAPDDSTGS